MLFFDDYNLNSFRNITERKSENNVFCVGEHAQAKPAQFRNLLNQDTSPSTSVGRVMPFSRSARLAQGCQILQIPTNRCSMTGYGKDPDVSDMCAPKSLCLPVVLSEYTPSPSTSKPQYTPSPSTSKPQYTPSPSTSKPQYTPSPSTSKPQYTPSPSTSKPQYTPSPSTSKPQYTPSPSTSKPQYTPSPSTSKPQYTPSPSTSKPQYTPSPSTSKPQYTPSPSTSKPQYTPSPSTSKPQYTPSPSTSKPQYTPSPSTSKPQYTPSPSTSKPQYTPSPSTSKPQYTPSPSTSKPQYTPSPSTSKPQYTKRDRRKQPRFKVAHITPQDHGPLVPIGPFGKDRSISEENKSDEPKTDLICGWIDCGKVSTDMTDFVKHVSDVHVETSKDSVCRWRGCPREREKAFKAHYLLVSHMRSHTGEKPFHCHFYDCKKAYSRQESLKTHLRSHTGDKPYKCQVTGCRKSFSNSSDRAKHLNRTHLNEKSYQCSVNGCCKLYTDTSSLRKHMTKKHGAHAYDERKTLLFKTARNRKPHMRLFSVQRSRKQVGDDHEHLDSNQQDKQLSERSSSE